MVGSVNACRDNFESGVRDMSQAEAEYLGWLPRLLTHPARGLEGYREIFEHLKNPTGAIKILRRAKNLVTGVLSANAPTLKAAPDLAVKADPGFALRQSFQVQIFEH